MPNIMLTYRCNLHCPYCFANEFVNASSTDMTPENFDQAIAFLTKQGPSRVGLIGGEPTLHPQFADILLCIINNPLITEATVYTNGILLDNYIKLLVHPKFRILVNWNSPADIGDKNFTHIRDNVDDLILNYQMKDRINIGVNLYGDGFDYTYAMELLQRYALHRVRISVTVPDFSQKTNVDVLAYFKGHKTFLMKFFRDMDSIQVLPYYDCNKPPYCIWTDEERAWLEAYVKKYPSQDSTLIGHKSYCFPVIDILPNLQAVRCFGMSDHAKVDITQFESVTDVASFFLNHVDALAYKIPAGPDCVECYQGQVRHCAAGCMGFKAEKITVANQYCGSL